MGAKLGVVVALLIVLSLPFVVRWASGVEPGAAVRSGGADKAVRTLVVVTPHVEQIRDEFGAAFARWHLREYKQAVAIDFRTPGGTSDIIRQLEATLDAAARNGQLRDNGAFTPGAAGFDVFFGGGSYEHSKMKRPRAVRVGSGASAKTVEFRMGQPLGVPKEQLEQLFGKNIIGTQTLYDPEQYWIGTALSGFGIVYNREVLRKLGLPDPASFSDLRNPKYVNLLALADGRQSGSITTTYDSILNKYGWVEGWGTLRDMAANARYFASSATKPPIDVGQGEAAAGLAIDFYGRGQAQFLLKPGQPEQEGRVGYVDPAGAVYIDADPASIMNGAADFELAQRFVLFCLTEEAQALWQFPALAHEAAKNNPIGADGRTMGPAVYELRRMPVRRVMYEKYTAAMIDKADPFKAASDVPLRGWRSAIAPLMAAFGIDTSREVREAWRVLAAARDKASRGSFDAKVLAEMERAFYAMPMHEFRPGSVYALPEILKDLPKPALRELAARKITTFDDLELAVKAGPKGKADQAVIDAWSQVLSRRSLLAGKEPVRAELSEKTYDAIVGDTDAWRDLSHGRRSLIAYTEFFRAQYRKVIQLGQGAGL